MISALYRNRKEEETFASSAGIPKLHDIHINLVPFQKMYGKTIYQGANIVHDMIGATSCCNIGLGSIRVDIFCIAWSEMMPHRPDWTIF